MKDRFAQSIARRMLRRPQCARPIVHARALVTRQADGSIDAQTALIHRVSPRLRQAFSVKWAIALASNVRLTNSLSVAGRVVLPGARLTAVSAEWRNTTTLAHTECERWTRETVLRDLRPHSTAARERSSTFWRSETANERSIRATTAAWHSVVLERSRSLAVASRVTSVLERRFLRELRDLTDRISATFDRTSRSVEATASYRTNGAHRELQTSHTESRTGNTFHLTPQRFWEIRRSRPLLTPAVRSAYIDSRIRELTRVASTAWYSSTLRSLLATHSTSASTRENTLLPPSLTLRDSATISQQTSFAYAPTVRGTTQANEFTAGPSATKVVEVVQREVRNVLEKQPPLARFTAREFEQVADYVESSFRRKALLERDRMGI